MKSKLPTSLALVCGLLMVCGPMFAHHGTSVSYDLKKTIVLKGTVTEYVFGNPHCQIFFDVKDDKGNVVHWGAETMAPRLVTKLGLTKNSLKAGDQVTLTVNPSKVGRPFGQVVSITPPNGQTITLITSEQLGERTQGATQPEKQ